jgi:hypothetical protein
MTDQAKPISRPWRRFLRFSMRGMIVVVLLVGGWLGWIVRSARIQREAVAAIKNAGGAVAYGWAEEEFSHPVDGPWWAPGCIVALAGVDFFGHVTAVGLKQFSTEGESPLLNIRQFAQLEDLDVSNSSFSDADLPVIEEVTSLRRFYLDGSRVTDAGLVHLRGLTNLAILNLDKTRVSDAGLIHLAGLSNLTTLRLNGTKVTDAGVKKLEQTLRNVKVSR